MIKLLLLAANPKDTDPLRLGEEARRIEEKIRESSGAHLFTIRSAWAVTVDELMYQLNSFEPNVVHFIGHGEANQIILETISGESEQLTPDALSVIFSQFRRWLQVVVLNACYSAHQAAALAEHADAVIGMSDAVDDAAAIEFSASLYRALGFGRSVQDAFAQAVAVLKVKGLPDADTPELTHRAGVDPAKLVLAGASDVALSIRRAQDPRVPARLRQLLLNGSEFLLIDEDSVRLRNDRAAEEDRIHLELGLRQSDTAFVVEVSRLSTVGDAATALARRLLPADHHSYTWTLVVGSRTLIKSHTLTMAGLQPGDRVLLVGNHLMPEWAPNIVDR